ncbi:dockerin type I domain-containing protein [Paenibacillus sp. GCM10027626]|uniref:dockerin type I domain-containing protein n=1 Tax=Paenibacillus sp. GCM10027626 TaxID=3273411 RepID=UPI0036437335
MRNIRKRCMLLALICSLIASLVLTTAPQGVNASQDNRITFKGRVFGEPQKIDTPIIKAEIAGAVVGEEDGRPVFYTTVNAELALFQVVDIKTNKLLYSLPMSRTQQAWAHVIAPDGTVYIGGIRTSGETRGILWQYSPKTHELVELGEPIPGEKSIWSLTTDDQGNVYGGTFQSGKVFKYDPVAKKFTDYGTMVAGQEYVRSIAYHDGYIYAGIGTVGDVIKLGVTDATKGFKQSIAAKVPELLGVPAAQVPFAYDMSVVGDYLFVKFTGELYKLLIYDLKTQTWLDHMIGKDTANGGTGAGVFSFAQLVTRDNKVYIPANGHLTELDLVTFEATPLIPYGTSLRGAAWVEFDDLEGYEGKSLVSMKANGDIVIFNVDAKTVMTRLSVLEGAPSPIHNIEAGPDGNLYMSAYPAGLGAVYNPRTSERKNLVMEQAEGMVAYGKDMYLGMYPGGHVYKIDTTLSTPVASKVFTIGEKQDRPYIMKVMEDKIMMGTIPGYGELGGALTIYDPATREHEVFRNIVQNQSIVGLAYKDGLIYGSTTIHGGLGVTATERSAKMFVWDVAKKSKVAEFTPNIPGLNNPAMISGLTVGPDGNIWGGVNGILFKMDPTNYDIIDYKLIYPDISSTYGMWRPYHPHWGKDGLLYIDLADRITVVNPKNMEFVRLFEKSMEVKFMTLAEDADGNENIYFADATDMGSLQMIAVSGEKYEHAGQLKLTGPDAAELNKPITVNLELDKANKLYGFKAKLKIDPAQWEIKGITGSEQWNAEGLVTWSANGSDVTIVGTQVKDSSFDGNLAAAHIQLVAKKNNPDAKLTLLGESETIRIDGDVTGVTHHLGTDTSLTIRIGTAGSAADINKDGRVDKDDLIMLAKYIGAEVNDSNRHMDLNGDGNIDIADLGLVGLEALK